jgi:hypothetical protein
MIFFDCLGKTDEALFERTPLYEPEDKAAAPVFNFRRVLAIPGDPDLFAFRAAWVCARTVQESVGALVPDWPTDTSTIWKYIDQEPITKLGWNRRSLVLMCLAKNLVFSADPISVNNVDIACHITAARMMGFPVVGIVPDAKVELDTSMLSNVDLLVPEHAKDAAWLAARNLLLGVT